MLSIENILDLPNDIKALIASLVAPDHTLWTWFAIHGSQFMNYSLYNRHTVVNLFTILHNSIKDHKQCEQSWKLFGKLHRENDQPALIQIYSSACWGVWWYDEDIGSFKSGTNKSWYINGLRHRDARDEQRLVLPAIECSNIMSWWCEGYRFREQDLPTFVSNGNQYWMYNNGEYHRKHGPAKIIISDEDIWHEYYFRNQRHNYNKFMPAVIRFERGKIIEMEWWEYGVKKKTIDTKKLKTTSDINYYNAICRQYTQLTH